MVYNMFHYFSCKKENTTLLFMKNIKFLSLTCFVFSLSLILAQGSTTLEEFNYIESGIPTQLKTGQDVYKRGYTSGSLYSMKWANGDVEEYIILQRDHDNSIAGLGCYTSSGWQMCIPINNKELMSRYRKDIKQFTLNQAQDYAYSLSYAFASSLDKLNKDLQETIKDSEKQIEIEKTKNQRLSEKIKELQEKLEAYENAKK